MKGMGDCPLGSHHPWAGHSWTSNSGGELLRLWLDVHNSGLVDDQHTSNQPDCASPISVDV